MKFRAVKNIHYIDGKPRYYIKEYDTKSLIALDCGIEISFREKEVAEKVAELLNKNYGEKR